MADEIIGVYDNTVARLEAMVCDRPHDGTKRLVHDLTVYEANDWNSIDRPTRKFMLVPTGQRNLGGTMMQDRLPGEVDDTLLLMVLYKQGASPIDLYKVIMSDFDRITYQLSVTAGFQTPTSTLSRRLLTNYSPVFDPGGSEGVAIVTASIAVTYIPTF